MNTLTETLETVTPLLLKFAAHHTRTEYKPTLAELATDAQDLYQLAVAEILKNCDDTSTRSYVLNLADWRMRNEIKKQVRYGIRVETEADITPEMSEDDLETVLDMVALDTTNPEEILIIDQDTEGLKAIISHLAPEHQVMIRLMADGCTLSEIAERMGQTYNTIYKRVLKIREAFQSAGLGGLQMA